MTHHFHRFIIVVVALVLTALPGANAFAQGSASISGQVIDETGGVLPGATVTLRDAASGRERSAVTDSGRFSVSGLAAGPYAITVTLSGFETLTREEVETNGSTTTVSLVMKVSSLRDSVVVRGTARTVMNSIAGKRAADGVMDMVSTDEMGRLPDKNIGETLNRIPGVSMLLEKGEGRFVQIRGISPRLNNVTINGMAIGNSETESGGRLLPLDVIGGELLSNVQVFKTPTPDMDAVQHTDNLVDEPNDNWEFRSGANTFGPDSFVSDEHGAIAITSPGRDRKDPSLQGFRRVRYYKQRTDEAGWIGSANVRRDLVVGGTMPAFLKFGAKFSQTKRQTEVSQPSYNIGTLGWNLSQVPGGHLGGFDNPVPMLTVPNLWLDGNGLNEFFNANRNDPRYFALDDATTYLSEYQSDFTIRERLGAAFAMGRIDVGKARFVVGLRAETTDVNSTAFNILNQGGRLTARPISGTGSYTTWLPSIVGTFDLRRNLIARAAFSTAVGRPDFDPLAPRSQLGIEDNPTLGTIGTLSIGNPELKARESRNLDAALEWYFDEGAVLSVSVFRKDISNEIIPAPTKIFTNYGFLGQTYNRFDINTTINAETADVNGVEFTFADRFDFLPSPLDGLGFAGSLTFIDSGVRVARGDEVLILPLLQQADRSTSATLYYQRGRLDVSTTYKYNANFLTDYGDSRALDLDQGSFGRWDLRAQCALARDLKLFVDGINLNDRPTREFQGGVASQITEHEYTGRTFMFGISARFGR